MNTKRKIISIDEKLCNGCGACVTGCHEGALQLINGKARIVSELFCDGLGACIGECPTGAITIEEREAMPYDETAVMSRIISQGEATIKAHLEHLLRHGETKYVSQALHYLKENNININNPDFIYSLSKVMQEEIPTGITKPTQCECPGSTARSFPAPTQKTDITRKTNILNRMETGSPSQLTHWPVQLHLQNPQASYFQEAYVLLAADCTAYAYGDFHRRFLQNHILTIACPKLDSHKESYIGKLTDMIDSARINTLSVVIMEVPCCGGLVDIARTAAEQAIRKIPVKKIVIGIQGDVTEETWLL